MKCHVCGAPIKKKHQFCAHCGAKLEKKWGKGWVITLCVITAFLILTGAIWILIYMGVISSPFDFSQKIAGQIEAASQQSIMVEKQKIIMENEMEG